MSSIVSQIEDKKSLVNIAASYGEVLNKNAWFYGFSGEYSRRIKDLPLGLAGTLMWDAETRRESQEKVNSTFSLAFTGTYLITNRLSVGTGVGKGFMDDDNPKSSYDFTNGDWSTAIFLGYNFASINRNLFGISGSFEYNISGDEFSISLDLSYGFAF